MVTPYNRGVLLARPEVPITFPLFDEVIKLGTDEEKDQFVKTAMTNILKEDHNPESISDAELETIKSIAASKKPWKAAEQWIRYGLMDKIIRRAGIPIDTVFSPGDPGLPEGGRRRRRKTRKGKKGKKRTTRRR